MHPLVDITHTHTHTQHSHTHRNTNTAHWWRLSNSGRACNKHIKQGINLVDAQPLITTPSSQPMKAGIIFYSSTFGKFIIGLRSFHVDHEHTNTQANTYGEQSKRM